MGHKTLGRQPKLVGVVLWEKASLLGAAVLLDELRVELLQAVTHSANVLL